MYNHIASEIVVESSIVDVPMEERQHEKEWNLWVQFLSTEDMMPNHDVIMPPRPFITPTYLTPLHDTSLSSYLVVWRYKTTVTLTSHGEDNALRVKLKRDRISESTIQPSNPSSSFTTPEFFVYDKEHSNPWSRVPCTKMIRHDASMITSGGRIC